MSSTPAIDAAALAGIDDPASFVERAKAHAKALAAEWTPNAG